MISGVGNMRHRRVGILSVVIAFASIGAPSAHATGEGTSYGGVATVANPDEVVSAEAQAIRFRETFGLDSSLATVRAGATDTAQYSSQLYGLPFRMRRWPTY